MNSGSLTILLNRYYKLDPRIPVAAILGLYLILGITILGFNRSIGQILFTSSACLIFEFLLCFVFEKKSFFPLSALITSFSLSFLLNYSHGLELLLIPVFFAIGSKHLFRLNDRHFLNPALVGVAFSLLFSRDLITAAPAYQWNGLASMAVLVFFLGMLFVIPKVNRHWLVLSFLLFFTLQTALRAWIMQHHLPFETLFLGTLSSPSFLIFTFFMITDPPTSPSSKKLQILIGFLIAAADLFYHLRQSYYTFFLAALTVAGGRFFFLHFRQSQIVGLLTYIKNRFLSSGYWKRPVLLASFALGGQYFLPTQNSGPAKDLDFEFRQIPSGDSGLHADQQGDLFQQVDPRIQHIIKWILSVGDAAAVADVNGDGKQDIFLTNLLKSPKDRATLYLQTGDLQFSVFPTPALDSFRQNPKTFGIVSNGIFVDFDNDGDQDLFLTVGFGSPVLLKNLFSETGHFSLIDVSKEVGLDDLYTNSLAASFADFNQDGLLDLIILNVWPENLPNYESPKKLNIFNLPEPQYDGDRRMFDFMHESWNLANNGGENLILLQNSQHQFVKQDSKQWGIPETRWSLAVGIADLNRDSWPDLYIANDFGPDDLYFNQHGKSFSNIKGKMFGSIGKDTYKGMNVSLADFDHTGWLSAYVSNVHHPLQAEGSLFWSFTKESDSPQIKITEEATQKGVLNERRFGWGASATDFNNDGWVDLAQANGMVDDQYDRKFETCPDYWYVNEKVARSPPEIHRYADRWGDIRGFCIFGQEKNRLYLNRGPSKTPQFIDVADQTGLTQMTNSRGAITADFSNHGRRDLLFTHQFQAPTLYRNLYKGLPQELPQWIGFELESLANNCNRDAVGTRIKLTITPQNEEAWSIEQEVQTVSGFSAQSDRRLHFGIGEKVKSISAEILWCGRFKQNLANLEPMKYHRLRFLKSEMDSK